MNELTLNLDNLNDLPSKTLLELVEKSKQMQRHLMRWNTTVRAQPSLFATLESLDYVTLVFHPSDGDIHISLTGDKHKLGKLWNILRGYDWVWKSARPKDGDTFLYGYFKHPEENFAPIWLNFSSNVCKRVQVGTQMVEQPIYETRCEGSEISTEVLS